ncbi:mitochondrial carrier domain-containing protein, partial [Panaeolus papilionaceus]
MTSSYRWTMVLKKSCSSSSSFPTSTMTSTLPPLVQAFSGAIGSASANALTYPLDLVITQLQLDPPQRRKRRGGILGTFIILKHIVRKHGWRALYDGLLPDTYATILSNFFYFYFYSFLRSLSTRGLISITGPQKAKTPGFKLVHKPTLMEELVLGFIAGVASRAVSTPLNIVTLKLQTERGEQEERGTDEDTKLLGITDVIQSIYKEKGIGGFWKGNASTQSI